MDAWAALRASLPPLESRALVLIDPVHHRGAGLADERVAVAPGRDRYDLTLRLTR